MNLKNIGTKIKSLRLQQKLSQMQLAEICNISSVHLSHIETGKVTMSLECMLKVCEELKTTPNYILLDEYSNQKNDKNFFFEYLNELTKDEIIFLIESANLLNKLKLNRNSKNN